MYSPPVNIPKPMPKKEVPKAKENNKTVVNKPPIPTRNNKAGSKDKKSTTINGKKKYS